jgi:hypothetical protein
MSCEKTESCLVENCCEASFCLKFQIPDLKNYCIFKFSNVKIAEFSKFQISDLKKWQMLDLKKWQFFEI